MAWKLYIYIFALDKYDNIYIHIWTYEQLLCLALCLLKKVNIKRYIKYNIYNLSPEIYQCFFAKLSPVCCISFQSSICISLYIYIFCPGICGLHPSFDCVQLAHEHLHSVMMGYCTGIHAHFSAPLLCTHLQRRSVMCVDLAGLHTMPSGTEHDRLL